MVKWQSRVAPRFLTDSDNGADAVPTVTESWKEEERDLDFLPAHIQYITSQDCVVKLS